MKKIIMKALVFTALTPIALVASQGEPLPAPKTGFYVGAALGGSDLTTKSNLSLNRLLLGLGDPAPQNLSLTVTDKNMAGDIFVGYGKRFNCLTLGGEVTGSFASLHSKTGLDTIDMTQSLEIKTTSAVEGALKLGYYLNTINKLYLKIGFELRRFNVNFTNPTNNFINLNRNYNSTAFVPGFGLEIDLTPCLSLRTEYRIALHPKKTVQLSNAASQTTSIQTKPTIHHVSLGLVFKM